MKMKDFLIEMEELKEENKRLKESLTKLHQLNEELIKENAELKVRQ